MINGYMNASWSGLTSPDFTPSYTLHSHQTPSSPFPPQIPTLPHVLFYLDDGYLCTCFSVGLGYKCLGSQDLQFQFSAIKCKSKSMKTNSIPDTVQGVKNREMKKARSSPSGLSQPREGHNVYKYPHSSHYMQLRNTFEIERLHG